MIKDMDNEDLIAFENQQNNNRNNTAPPGGQEASSTTQQYQSEIGRLQKLPGFQRLKKQLIVNLMTAPPDVTHKNIRVDSYNISIPPTPICLTLPYLPHPYTHILYLPHSPHPYLYHHPYLPHPCAHNF